MTATRVLEQQESVQATVTHGKISSKDWHVVPMSGGEEVGIKVIFWTGRPGSGKSTLMEEVGKHFEELGYTVVTLDDYHFLYARARRQAHLGEAAAIRLIKQGERTGFVVEDFIVLEQVLATINDCVIPHLSQSNTIVMIEFARASYLFEHVWRYFCPKVLALSCCVFCDADLDVCVERVEQRPNYVVSGDTMRVYYNDDGLISLCQSRPNACIEVVNTNGTVGEAKKQVLSFCNRMIASPAFKVEGAVSPSVARGWYRKSVLVNQLESYQRSVRG